MSINETFDHLNSYLYSSRLSRLARPFSRYMGQILMFHKVAVQDDAPRIPENQLYEVTPEVLRDVIRFYRERQFDFISLDEMMLRLEQGKSGRRFVTFTFDDGYTDTLTTAYPVLKEENVPFCVYITTDYPERKAILWWDILEETLISREQLSFNLDGKSHSIVCMTPAEKQEAFKIVCQLVLKSAYGISAAWRAIFNPLGIEFAAVTNRLGMSWEQIESLSRDPLVTIGAHTCSHPSLAGLDEAEVRDEISQSQKLVQDHIQKPVCHFAYPYGSRLDAANREARIAADLGFTTAVTTVTDNVKSSHRKNALLLPRLNVNRHTYLRDLTLAVDGCII